MSILATALVVVPETAPLTDAELEAFWTHWTDNSTSFPGISLTGFIDVCLLYCLSHQRLNLLCDSYGAAKVRKPTL